MRLVKLTAYVVRLPLRRKIKHASQARSESENIVVRCTLGDGTEGWGEGVPRAYVTGESPDGALAQLAATPLAQQLERNCENWDDVVAMCEGFQPEPLCDDPRGCGSNALRCAVELSILDAFGRLFDQPVSTVTHRFGPADPLRATLDRVRYSSVVTHEGAKTERISALKMRLYGFNQCKVKVGMPAGDDRQRLRRIRRWIGRRMDLRLDANEAWDGAEARKKIEPLLAYNVSCVEQPVPHEQVQSLAELRQQLDVKLMLDESLTSQHDAQQAIYSGTCDLFNIRLSKCGGFLSSLRLAALAHQSGIGYQLGCHPGESGILSAAGRHWATSVREVCYLEGSYDRHILSEQLTNEDMTFGYGGRAAALTGPGLGVTINPTVLQRLTTRQQAFQLD